MMREVTTMRREEEVELQGSNDLLRRGITTTTTRLLLHPHLRLPNVHEGCHLSSFAGTPPPKDSRSTTLVL
jgi:hypothetical protein